LPLLTANVLAGDDRLGQWTDQWAKPVLGKIPSSAAHGSLPPSRWQPNPEIEQPRMDGDIQLCLRRIEQTCWIVIQVIVALNFN